MTKLERMVFAAAMVAGADPKRGLPSGDVEAGARAVAALRLEAGSYKGKGESETPAGWVMRGLKAEVSAR